MVSEIISKYVNENYSLERLAKEYSMGKLKLKSILLSNNIKINKKGNKQKYFSTGIDIKIHKHHLECKKCGKIFKDFENKSGSITNHIVQCYPEIIIPSPYKRRMFLKENGFHYHSQFFNQKEIEEKELLVCPLCDWGTIDLKNKSGALTKHIELSHGYLTDFIEKFPHYEIYFNPLKKINEKNSFFEDSNNYIVCKVCGEKHQILSNSHLKLHGLTPEEYKLKFNENIISKNLYSEFKNNLLTAEIPLNCRSKGEIEVCDFIQSLGFTIQTNVKNIIPNVELDIFIPSHNIAIEFNGLFWHSEKQGKTKLYHIEKTKKCLDQNIRLIHIFSDEWDSKKNILKNRLSNLLGKSNNKIYARKCKIVSLTKDEKKSFLNDNHLQGNDNSTIFYGLKYDNEIVATITFGKLRNVLGNKNKDENHYEIYRYCSKNVIGGFSRLIKYFIKEYKPNKIITYSDRNWSPSNEFCFYKDVGFDFIGETKPNYYYTKKYNKREHRFNFRKDKLIRLGYDKSKTEFQIMDELGYDRIWDTGNLKYEINLK